VNADVFVAVFDKLLLSKSACVMSEWDTLWK